MVDKSEKFRWLVRLGYAARGVTYILLGWLALGTRAESGDGNEAVLNHLQDMPLGTPILYIMAVGLVSYGLFKVASAVADVQNRGTDAKAVAKRVGDGASAVAYTFLAFTALQFAGGSKQSAEGGQGQEVAGTVLDWSLGGVVVGLVGLGFLAGAVMQAKEAATGQFMHRVSAQAPNGIGTVGRAGHAARAVVFAIIGWSLVQSAWLDSSSGVKGLGEALLSLRESGALYTLVAVGLMLFGAFSLVVARYRIIPDISRAQLKPSFR